VTGRSLGASLITPNSYMGAHIMTWQGTYGPNGDWRSDGRRNDGRGDESRQQDPRNDGRRQGDQRSR
jgi:hypothetical protein